MKKISILFLSFVFCWTMTLTDLSFADYLIKLKNGRKIYTPAYTDAGNKIKVYSGGGEMMINKQAIADIKEVKVKRTEGIIYRDLPARTPGAESSGPDDRTAREDEGSELSDLFAELSELYDKKRALSEERQGLMEKRKQIEEEIMADQVDGRLSGEKRADIAERADELERQMKEFNKRLEDIESREREISARIKSLQPEQEKPAEKEPAAPDM